MNIERWFQHRPLAAERAALALCYQAADKVPEDWREMNRSTKIDWAKTFEASRDPDGKNETFMREVYSHRAPPLPGQRLILGSVKRNHCPVCCRPTFAGGDWRESAGKPRWNKNWHAPCYMAHAVWRDPGWIALRLAMRQGGICAITDEPILRDGRLMGEIEIDHVVPLWQVSLTWTQYRWPAVLRMWGPSNLQALSKAGHARKTADEARLRAEIRRLVNEDRN